MAHFIPPVSDLYGTSRHSVEGKSIARKQNWVEGWWENISFKPIYIKDKEHLKQVCVEEGRKQGRTIIPKAFVKAKSQGKGIEWSY